MTERVAVFGGSFNPMGNHHLAVIQWIAEHRGFTRCLVVPSIAHALKDRTFPFEHRYNMAQEAALHAMRNSARIQIKVSMHELEMLRWQTGPIYTIQLLRSLRELEPDTELRFIVGPDIIKELDKWKYVDEIRSEFGFVEAPDMGTHASEIRRILAEGFPGWKDLVPPGVADYIELHKLYQETS